MLNEKEVLERGFRALDELVGRPATRKDPGGISGADTPAEGVHEGVIPVGVPGKETTASTLKGDAVELWSDHAGGRVFIAADEEDAQEVIRRFGARRGEIWIPGEIELVARIQDQAIRDEVAAFKRQTDGCLNGTGLQGIPWAEWKAAALNQLFKEQGGKPGRITAATVRHGEVPDGE